MNVAAASFIIALGLGALYEVYRKESWPKTAAQIRIPKAGWIVAILIAVVVAYLVYVMSRDPLEGRF
jgi:hypothetical protein